MSFNRAVPGDGVNREGTIIKCAGFLLQAQQFLKKIKGLIPQTKEKLEGLDGKSHYMQKPLTPPGTGTPKIGGCGTGCPDFARPREHVVY